MRARRGQQGARGAEGRGLSRLGQPHHLDLSGETHGPGERLQVVDADGVAHRREKTARVQLDALALLEATRAGQESLEPVGVVLHRPVRWHSANSKRALIGEAASTLSG
jgi:hypothetical protein